MALIKIIRRKVITFNATEDKEADFLTQTRHRSYLKRRIQDCITYKPLGMVPPGAEDGNVSKFLRKLSLEE